MSLVRKGRLLGLLPHIVPARVRPRLVLDGLVRQHAEGRDDVLLEILVLIVTPDHDQVGREIVEHPSRLAEPREERLAMLARGAEPFIVAPVATHVLRPSVRHAVFGGKVGVLEDAPQDARHVLVASGQEWNVCQTESENRSHGGSSYRAASLAGSMVHSHPPDGKEIRSWALPRFRLSSPAMVISKSSPSAGQGECRWRFATRRRARSSSQTAATRSSSRDRSPIRFPSWTCEPAGRTRPGSRSA